MKFWEPNLLLFDLRSYKSYIVLEQKFAREQKLFIND